ncbi:hypothetical protein [Sporosarcina sp. E16_8]|uniref:hypothetical protein n=1 Tax=Sporosarcina sp. E16_8 TaxID=2789295 RepID=UPI001A91C0EE|nr:hypothetical protein [Sporosarcina sp. E16_8]MBO0586109.1 hypothetical protein [Sporosarcina sp. E16_8]
MGATDKELVRAKGDPAPQYFNPLTNRYEVITGRDGANMFVQMGTIAAESWQGSANETKVFPSNRYGFSIVNDGNSDVSFTINGNTRVVKKYESYSALFRPFVAVAIVTTSAYRAEVLE